MYDTLVIECLLPSRPEPHSNLNLQPHSNLHLERNLGPRKRNKMAPKNNMVLPDCALFQSIVFVVISPFGLNSNNMASTVNCMAAHWSSLNSITCSKMCFFSNEKKAHKGVRSLQLITQTLKVGFSWFDEIK